jgi:hypothetical protein
MEHFEVATFYLYSLVYFLGLASNVSIFITTEPELTI